MKGKAILAGPDLSAGGEKEQDPRSQDYAVSTKEWFTSGSFDYLKKCKKDFASYEQLPLSTSNVVMAALTSIRIILLFLRMYRDCLFLFSFWNSFFICPLVLSLRGGSK